MSDPQTPNIGLFVPLRGSDVDAWDVPVNQNMLDVDGMFGGVQTISIGSTPVTLTSPLALATPTPGPTQSQNFCLTFTGALTANVPITLPLPGFYIVDNETTGAFLVTLRAVGSGQIIAIPPGAPMHIFCNGVDVKFVNFGRPADLVFFSGVSALPAWVGACTKPPYLLLDGAIYNIATFSALGGIYGSTFGGNGSTTFGVPDGRGRVLLPYDGTGTRITVAGSGINGQLLGASGGIQSTTIARADLPNVVAPVTIVDPGHQHVYQGPVSVGGGGTSVLTILPETPTATSASTTGISANLNLNGGVTQTTPSNVQPAQVAGILAVKT